jgi:hypothetical protein
MKDFVEIMYGKDVINEIKKTKQDNGKNLFFTNWLRNKNKV